MSTNPPKVEVVKGKLQDWRPEDQMFWDSAGKAIANRNLSISIPCLLCGFAVWLYWSVITVQMQNLGFPFPKEDLYTLAAIGGLTGATLRIPNSFFIALSGGRNVITLTTLLLIIPSAGAGFALQDPTTSFSTFAILAALSGLGGGAFASSMSNISFFFPKKVQGLALGLNAGLGNVGVSIMQVLLPFVMTFGLFGALGGEPRVLPEALGGGQIWIQNGGLIWVPLLGLLTLAAWFGMNNLPNHDVGSAPVAMGKVLWLLLLGFGAAAVGLALLLSAGVSMWLVLPITVVLTVFSMRWLTPKMVRDNLAGQFIIFRKKHNWVMTWLYTMTFGSFIGYSAAFPKLIQDVFGSLPDGSLNPNAPNPLHYAWLGPLVGSLVRPVGGWISDKWGGARVTQWDTVVMIASALGVAWTVKAAGASATPEVYFMPFLLLFLVLFTTTGIGNGSTFRMIPIIFEKDLAGPVLGWTSAIAAYGAFIIPKVFGGQIKAGTPELALYGFAIYYTSCLAVNWWFYAEKKRGNPVLTERPYLALALALALFPGPAALISGCEPTNQGYQPQQPIEFSHAVHAGAMEVPCQYCHFAADRSRHAGIPPAVICMNCHEHVQKDHPEVLKVKEALATETPIAWVRIHSVPDHVYFDHSSHTNGGVECQACHGPVQNMGRVEQFAPLTMGWCVNCHREQGDGTPEAPVASSALTDCAVCHH